ncbi:MAG TPA: amidohydrolase family protein [Coriobacteriia bacterium]
MLLTAKYVIPVSAHHIDDGAVLVRDDRIVAVGTRAELVAAHPSEEVRDFGLAVLMPGFVDLHTHLEYSVFRGAVDDVPYTAWKMQVQNKEARLSAEDWMDSAVLGSMEAVGSGITTIADITTTGNSVRAAKDIGLSGVVYREVSSMDKSQVAGRMGEAASDIEAWGETAADAAIEIGIAPHSPYTCHPSLFTAAAELAIERDLPVAIHLAGSRDEYDFVRYGSSNLAQDFREQSGWRDVAWMPTGVSPVQYVLQWGLFDVPRVLAVHCVQVDEHDIDVLAQHNVAVAHCPRCNAKLGMGIAPLKSFFEHGLTVGLGTDSPASNNTVDPFDEMRIGLLLQRGVTGESDFYRYFTARTFIRLATIHGARALGLEDEIGSLEPGKRADIIAVDLSSSPHMVPTADPYSALVHTANQKDVLATMVAGRWVFDRGDYRTVDKERALARAREIREKLRG